MMKRLHNSSTECEVRQMPGFAIKFLAKGAVTDGAYDLMEAKGRKGAEPGLHYHKNEDEAFYMLEGEMMVQIGDDEYHVRAGDYIMLPRNIPHRQQFLTDTIHVLLMINPAGYEGYFRELTEPTQTFEAPPLPEGPPPQEMLQKMQEVNEKYAVTFVE